MGPDPKPVNPGGGEFVHSRIVIRTIVVLLLDMPPDAFHLRLDYFGENEEEEVTAKVANEALNRFPNQSFLVLTYDLKTRSEEIQETFESILSPDATFVKAGADLSSWASVDGEAINGKTNKNSVITNDLTFFWTSVWCCVAGYRGLNILRYGGVLVRSWMPDHATILHHKVNVI